MTAVVSQENLANQLEQDVRDLANSFISQFGLAFEEQEQSLSDPLLRWLDFTNRYIPPKPRQVIYAKHIVKSIPKVARSGFKNLIAIMKAGRDLNPFQSKSLILHNDISGKRKQKRTDHLWAHWGIHHLHITTGGPKNGSFFSERSSWVMFCIVGEDFIGIVDVRHHDDENLFADPDLIKIIARNWPESMERFKMKNVIAVSGANGTSAEISATRKAGINSAVEIDGSYYLPSGGITTALTPIQVTNSMLKIDSELAAIAKELTDINSPWLKSFTDIGNKEPEFHIVRYKYSLAIFDKNNDILNPLRQKDLPSDNPSSILNDAILPVWAARYLERTAPGK